MFKYKGILTSRALLVGATVMLLSACGGGGSGSGDISDRGTDSDYVGSRASAALTPDNTLEFTSLLYGQTDASNLLLERSSNADSSFKGILSEINTLKRLVGGDRSIGESKLQARAISETEDCTYGGTIAGVGNVDESSETGTIKLTATNCEEESGTILNGVVRLTIESSDNPESFTLEIDDLSITQNGASFSQTGVLTSYWKSSEDGSVDHIIETLNLVTTNNTTSEQVYLQDFNFEEKDGAVDLSGKIFLSGEGYVTVSGSSDLSLWSEADSPLPQNGFIYLRGSNGSTARISSIPGDYERFTLELDEDGDGVFESTSIQDLATDGFINLVDR